MSKNLSPVFLFVYFCGVLGYNEAEKNSDAVPGMRRG